MKTLFSFISDLSLHPKNLQTAKPNLLLIKPALLQMLYELRMILLKCLQQILNEFWPRYLDVFKVSVTIVVRLAVAHFSRFVYHKVTRQKFNKTKNDLRILLRKSL